MLKKRKLLASAALAILSCTLPSSALAWNDLGHMAVACLAYKNLNEKTRTRVDQLVKLNPLYADWKKELSQQVPAEKLNLHLFMLCASWPDIIRKDSSYVADGDENGNRPAGPDAARNIGFEDKLMHKYWHFYDRPILTDNTASPAIPVPNAVSQLAIMRKAMKSKAADGIKAYDLCWILHIAGDLHQPLHCSTRVSKQDPHGDNGGNNVYINNPFVKEGEKPKQRLHWFWDNCVGSGFTLKAEQYADSLAKESKELEKQAKNTKVLDWVKESWELCQSHVYVNPIGQGNGPFKITEDYVKAAEGLARVRIALAGKRLSKILNQELR